MDKSIDVETCLFILQFMGNWVKCTNDKQLLENFSGKLKGEYGKWSRIINEKNLSIGEDITDLRLMTVYWIDLRKIEESLFNYLSLVIRYFLLFTSSPLLFYFLSVLLSACEYNLKKYIWKNKVWTFNRRFWSKDKNNSN